MSMVLWNMDTLLCSHMSMAAFALQQQSKVVVTETSWPHKAQNIYYLGFYRKTLHVPDTIKSQLFIN